MAISRCEWDAYRDLDKPTGEERSKEVAKLVPMLGEVLHRRWKRTPDWREWRNALQKAGVKVTVYETYYKAHHSYDEKEKNSIMDMVGEPWVVVDEPTEHDDNFFDKSILVIPVSVIEKILVLGLP